MKPLRPPPGWVARWRLRTSLALLGTPVIQRDDDATNGKDVERIGAIKEADKITGGLSRPANMLRDA